MLVPSVSTALRKRNGLFFALPDLRCVIHGELGYTCGKTKASEDGIKFRFTDERRENWGFSSGASGKEPTCQCKRHKETQVQSLERGGRSPGEWHSNPLQYSCLENPMDRSLVGYSPWGCTEWDMTEREYGLYSVKVCEAYTPFLIYLISVILAK